MLVLVLVLRCTAQESRRLIRHRAHIWHRTVVAGVAASRQGPHAAAVYSKQMGPGVLFRLCWAPGTLASGQHEVMAESGCSRNVRRQPSTVNRPRRRCRKLHVLIWDDKNGLVSGGEERSTAPWSALSSQPQTGRFADWRATPAKDFRMQEAKF